MYYNSSTAADAQATTSVWNSNFAAVWHLKETATSTASYVKDSTLNANNGSSTGVSYPAPTSTGQIDGAQSFDGGNDRIDVIPSETLNNLPQITVSGWLYMRTNGEASSGRLFAKAGGSNSPINGWLFKIGSQLDFIIDYLSSDRRWLGPGAGSVSLNAWHYVVATWDGSTSGSGIHVYVDSVEIAGATFDALGDRQDDSATPAFIGNGISLDRTINGLIDEVRISSSTRSAAWIWDEYKAGTDTLNTYAAAESNLPSAGGGSSTPSPSPIVSLSLNPSLITYGASSTLFWSYANVSSCLTPSGWSNPLSLPGSASLIVIPTQTTNYSISCTGRGGYASQSVTLSVSDSSSHNTASFQGNTVSASTSSLPATMLEMEDLLRKLLRELRSLRIKLWRMENPQPFVRNLSFGSEGNDVLSLQLFLITYDSGPYAQRLSSLGANGHFGPNTQRALMEFQESAGIEPHAGYFGQKTRGYVGGL